MACKECGWFFACKQCSEIYSKIDYELIKMDSKVDNRLQNI